MKNFLQICKKTQPRLKKWLGKELGKRYERVEDHDGFLFAQGTFPVLLVAHLDTVHESVPQKIFVDKTKKVLCSPQGIGGDDRCGVYMIMKIIEKVPCSVLFTEDEERGCVGADKFIRSPVSSDLQFSYIIELDRKGENDAVFYDCANEEFIEDVCRQFFHESYGSVSDISVIAPKLGCAAVNLSCGYYNAHTLQEYVKFEEMQRVIKETITLLNRLGEKKYKYVENVFDFPSKYSSYINTGYDFYIVFQDENGKMSEECYFASSEAEAVGFWALSHPNLPLNQVVDILKDEYGI